MLKISIGKRLLRIKKNLYIGDFEIMKIKDLCIYKIAKTLFKDTTKASYKVSFGILNKKSFHKKKNLLYDVESFFEKIILSFTKIEVLSLHSFIKSQIEQVFIRLNYLEKRVALKIMLLLVQQ
jgi:hypothetical protein